MTSQTKSAYLKEFDYFRGIAILIVVFWHMIVILGEHEFLMNGYAEFSKLISFTFNCSTGLFVFISGFMFYWVYYRRGFRYGAFLHGKFNNLFRPYFLIATIFSLTHLIYGAYTGRLAEWNFWIDNAVERFFLDTWMYWSFWYMPFIAVVFILSPVYLKFIRLRIDLQFFLLAVNLLMSCSVGRDNTDPLQSCVFFSPFYLFGIICAQNYKQIKNFSVKFWIRLLWLYLMTILLVAVFGRYEYGAVHLPLPTLGITFTDVTPVFKLPECLLLLLAGEKLANTLKTLKEILTIMGKFSFTVFFLHNFFISAFEEMFFWGGAIKPLQDNVWLYVVGFAMAAVVCGICIFVAARLKERLGTNSRIYIGT